MDKETRAVKLEAGEFRFAEGEKRTLEGYAAVFGAVANLGQFDEIIEPGAFTRSLAGGADVRALIDHDPGRIIGRTKSGTLTLEENDHGLWATVELPETREANDLATLVDRGDLDGMSFGFRTVKDRWETREGRNVRYLEDVDIFDISIVSFPAYDATEVALRSLENIQAAGDAEIMRRRYQLMMINNWRMVQ